MATSLATLLQQAAERLEQLDFGSAQRLYQQALQSWPNNAAAAMGVAVILNRTGRPAEALALCKQVWAGISKSDKQPPTARHAIVLAQIGLANEQLGRIEDALQAFRQARRVVASPDLERHIRELEPLASSPAPVQTLILSARTQLAAGYAEEAGKSFQVALQLQPDSAPALHGMALALRQLKRSAQAVPLLQKAVMLDPERADYFNDLGLLFHDVSDFEKAASFHKRAIKVDKGFVSAYVNLGVAYKRMGRMEESEQAYRKALSLQPSSAQAHNNLGNLLRLLDRLEEARDHLKKALELQPGYAGAQDNLEAVEKAIDARRAEASSKHPRSAGRRAPVAQRAKAKPARRAASR